MSVLGFSFSTKDHCESCYVEKSSCLSFILSNTKTTTPFELIHSYVWGPTSISSYNGFRYYIDFVDDYSKFTWLYPLKRKSEAYLILVNF